MLIFSNSMCKSASTLMWWYTERIVYHAHQNNGGAALRELTNSGEVPGADAFVDHPLTDEKIDRLLALAKNNGPTVVKVHCFLTPYLRQVLLQAGAMVTFCYRDPRDMILSAMDHRERAAKQGRTVFEQFTTVKNSLREAEFWCRMSCTWVESGLAKLFLYTDTVSNPVGQIKRLADYLNVDVTDQQIESIFAAEDRNKSVGWCEFNKGDLTRYKTEMQPFEIELCNQYLGKYIRQLGFEVEEREARDASDKAA